MKMKDFNISMTQYHRGDIITGTIVMIGAKEVVVALGGLKEGVFPKDELNPAFKIGDAILVMVTGDIDEKGCLVLTHRDVNKALEDKEKLRNLKVGSELSFKVDNINNSGLLGEFMGYRVFLPFSQCTTQDYIDRDVLKDREIDAIVIELDNIKKSIVCSTKLLAQQDITPVEPGDVISGTIIKIEDKYAIAFLKNGAKAKLSISDASHDHINNMSEVVELNQEYDFKILDTNMDFSRISIGIKQLTKNPMEELFETIKLGDELEGVVVKILSAGAVIKLDNGLTAFAVTKDNSDRANVATHHIYKLNSRVKGYISHINHQARKLNIITNVKKETL
ncbi:MAG: S1 RNA-binding domain-containing protein [Clostridia bacterium]